MASGRITNWHVKITILKEDQKQHAWFCMLQRLDSGLDSFQIQLVLKAYIAKKTKVVFKLKHLSSFLNEEELIYQILDEIQDDKKKIQSARIEGFEDRFK